MSSTRDLLRRLLAEYEITLKAELDQEHIVDQELLVEIVDLVEIDKDDIVLEVGPGIGNITELIAERAKHVYAVEKYLQFEKILQDRCKGKHNVDIIFSNIMDINLPVFDKLVSNLPFSICESFLQKLVHSDFELGGLITPLSFANIITARPDDSRASKLSILASAFFHSKIEKVIEREAFCPAPDFSCALLKLVPYDTTDMMTIITRYLLRQRDKKTKNALRTALVDAHRTCNKTLSKLEARKIVEALDLEPSVREVKIGALPKGPILQIIRALQKSL